MFPIRSRLFVHLKNQFVPVLVTILGMSARCNVLNNGARTQQIPPEPAPPLLHSVNKPALSAQLPTAAYQSCCRKRSSPLAWPSFIRFFLTVFHMPAGM